MRQKTVELHQAGMNGAQAVLQALMDCEVIDQMPELVKMTSTWKGGIGGNTCSAFAAATLVIGLSGEKSDEKLAIFNQWFKDNFGSISCPSITEKAGGRPSKEQKVFCDALSGDTAEYIYQLCKDTQLKEKR